jgi:hypothetical protein
MTEGSGRSGQGPSLPVEPFTIHVEDEVLEDLPGAAAEHAVAEPAPGPAWVAR